MNKNTRKKLLAESSTSDGATLWLVLNNMGSATLDDILVEIRDEMHLFHLILGGAHDQKAMAEYRLFVNRSAALDLAQSRIDGAGGDSGDVPDIGSMDDMDDMEDPGDHEFRS